MLIYLICFCLIGSGMYLLLCEILHIPTLASSQAAMEIARGRKSKSWNIDALIMVFAAKISRYIKLSAHHKKDLIDTLNQAGINMQPETYISSAIIKMLLKLLFLIPFSMTVPLMDLVVILWAVNGLFNDIGTAQKIVREKREEIERDLPRLASTIEEHLHSSRNIQAMLISFKNSACEAFKNELELTIADMQSGFPEKALERLEARVNSFMMSEIVRGLQAVMRGDNGITHFAMLSYQYRKLDQQKLEMFALKRPGNVKGANYLMMIAGIATLFCAIGMYMFKLVRGMV